MSFAASVPLRTCAPNAPNATARKQNPAARRKRVEFTPRKSNATRLTASRSALDLGLRLLVLPARFPHLIRHFLRAIERVLRPIVFINGSRGGCDRGDLFQRRFTLRNPVAIA